MKSIKSIIASTDFRIILVASVYILAAQIGIGLTFPETKLAALWPTSGIALSLLIITGYRSWPAIVIGSILANIMAFLHFEVSFSIASFNSIIITSIANTTEALLGYFLIHKFIKSKNPFLKTIHVFKYLGIAILISAVGASIGSFGLLANGIIDQSSFAFATTTWWVSNVVSILIITPVIISWTKPFNPKITVGQIIEWLVFATSLGVIGIIIYYNLDSVVVLRALPFVIVPFLLWLGFRFNLQTTTAGIVVVAFISIYFTINQLGPFVLENENSSMLLLQVFAAIISVSSIVLYATVHERKLAQALIEEFNHNLEEKVKERTKELNTEIETRKITEEKIKISNKKLRKVNVELDNFVYSVSHDLRAPIASVLGLVNLASQEDNVNVMHTYLDMIGKSAKQQDAFIQDILDLSRNDRLEIFKEEIKFNDLINEIFDQLKYTSDKVNIIKEIEIDQERAFFSDPKRLKVILNNLLSNAIRYSNGSDAQIKIGIKVDENIAKISITDNGLGIPKEHIDNVFKMFYRATENNAGSGLGLYIVKETVDKLRGNVELSSEINLGTTVNIEIPNISLN